MFLEVDVPVKNLLTVNSSNETLSGKATYANLRHCALSELFKYAPKRNNIPAYAWKNFGTHFTYCDIQDSQLISHHVIRSDEELTIALTNAATKNLMDDNDGIILHIQCKFINQFHYKEKETEKIRKQATAAAEQVFNTLKEWVKKASQFVKDQTSKNESEDYVVLPKETKGSNYGQEHLRPIEWTTRFIHALMVPDVDATWTHVSSEEQQMQKEKKNGNNHVDQYEEIADSLLQGIDTVSSFVWKLFNNNEQFWRKIESKNELSITPSKADENISLSSFPSTSTDSLAVIDKVEDNDKSFEQGVEIVFDCNGEYTNEEEWKVFFDPNEAIMIDSPWDAEVISISSSSSSSSGSEDESSWAIFSDEE